MTVAELQRLYDYGYWANAKLLQVISQLTPEEFTRPVAGSYGSIRDTLVHVMSAEWGWLDRCGGPERGPALKPSDYPTVEALVETWGAVERYVRSFLSSMRPIMVSIIGGRLLCCSGCSGAHRATSTCCSTMPTSGVGWRGKTPQRSRVRNRWVARASTRTT